MLTKHDQLCPVLDSLVQDISGVSSGEGHQDGPGAELLHLVKRLRELALYSLEKKRSLGDQGAVSNI